MGFGLTRAQLFAKRPEDRKRIYNNRLLTAVFHNAEMSARKYARFLLAEGIVDGVTYRGRFGWTKPDRLEMAGGLEGIQHTLHACYKVPKVLCPIAAKRCIELVKGGL